MHFENRTKHPTTPNGKIIWLEREDRLKLKSLDLSIDDVQDRINKGWEPYEAMSFSAKYEMHDGQIYYTHSAKEQTFYIPAEDMEKAEVELGINPRTVAKRLNRGFSTQEALTKEVLTSEVYEVKQDIEAQKAKERKRQERRRMKKAQRAKQRDMERRPHMYDGTPQQHTRGAYTSYLMKNDIFPKVAK
ncbi:SA1788 family PVL leukocidin-associated protein [Staphylococcus arlettae]|uniref:SA1788 family PVL leukocidin-associated protein n=1 Tax=Staphylococcus arlettae TaxID=29378 RepID=UPI0021D0BE7F|nr:SA1788 family PVL leukocidin-associated protein [Staphylococcus arlettae]UXU53183.1 hypothetical protein MUA71_03655 [Staphylococcus arlettae]